MVKAIRDFISKKERVFKIKIGKTLASSLTGFIAGVIFTLLALGGAYLIVYLIRIIFG